tara:strand:+ start:9277 stop:10635 length:1359 start_codon:yes stop_codon:yes gene_type:complete
LDNYLKRLLNVIPGGAHTYSRGFDQFPSNAPQILTKGKGAYIYDDKNHKYLDYGMGLRAVNLGYANDEVNNAAIEQIKNGVNMTRPSFIELEAAELFVDLIDSVDMVKFTKNGSTAVSAAVKLSRAYTGKNMVARCSDHPFFSYDDWFIGSTVVNKGVPQTTINDTKLFKYNDIKSLEVLFDKYPNKFACVVLEPATEFCPGVGEDLSCCSSYPCTKTFLSSNGNFLKDVENLCKKNNVIFILDEMITGFRYHLKGAQHLYGVKPDISTFGKAMANGFSLACVGGNREIMQQGSIEAEGDERVFLLSTTHGSEMPALGAFISTINIIKQKNVIEHLWKFGTSLINIMNSEAKRAGLEDYFFAYGVPCLPNYITYDSNKNKSLAFKTLFMQEMLKRNILIPFISPCFSHKQEELELTINALRDSFVVYKEALGGDIENYISGEIVKPVFRKFN